DLRKQLGSAQSLSGVRALRSLKRSSGIEWPLLDLASSEIEIQARRVIDMVRYRLVLALVAVLLCLHRQSARAQVPSAPTDNDLHSVYCIHTLQFQIQMTQQFLDAQAQLAKNADTEEIRQMAARGMSPTQQHLSKLQSALDRLQMYFT